MYRIFKAFAIWSIFAQIFFFFLHLSQLEWLIELFDDNEEEEEWKKLCDDIISSLTRLHHEMEYFWFHTETWSKMIH